MSADPAELLRDILDGHADIPTDPAPLAALIDVASIREYVLLADRFALQVFDPDDADLLWDAAQAYLAAQKGVPR